jgi:toxin ParE1/3/4
LRLRWTRRAIDDLREIRAYIARDDPAAGARWVQRLRQRARLAARAPRAGRIVPELEREDVREVFVRSYRIVYELTADELRVLTVFEGHRLLSEPGSEDEP